MKRLLLLLAVSSLVACAVAPQRSATTPTSTSAPPPSASGAAPSLETTGTSTGVPGGDSDKTPSSIPGAKAPSTAPAGAGGSVVMPGDLASAQKQVDEAAKAFAASGTDCVSLCKSLVSMTNATEHLCGLTEGTTDQQRCVDARAKLSTAQAKVKSTCGNTCG